MRALSKEDVEKLVGVVFDSIGGDRWYEPWEWDDDVVLPEGFSNWEEPGAVDTYFALMQERAVASVLLAFKKQDWSPGRR